MVKAGSSTFNLFVTNDYTTPTPQEGTLTSPFTDIENAIRKLYEVTSPYLISHVTIYLTMGVHYIRKDIEWLYRVQSGIDKES